MLILKTNYMHVTRKLMMLKGWQDSAEVLHSLTSGRSRQGPGEEVQQSAVNLHSNVTKQTVKISTFYPQTKQHNMFP